LQWAWTDCWPPVRLIKPTGKPGQNAVVKGRVFHLSYAEPEEIVKFKWSVSGHKRELRSEWMEDIFLANRRTDCHPTTKLWWNAIPFDKSTMPDCLKSHENFHKEIIR